MVMYQFLCLADAKAEAYAILEILRDLDPETKVPLGHCYELIARRAGFDSWREYKKVLDPEPEKVPEGLRPGEVYVEQLTRDEMLARAKREKYMLAVQLSVPVTLQTYTEAVVHLFNVTQMRGTSGARACARLLLSLYNTHEWHFDVSELSVLDYDNYVPAITALRGRFELMIEPQQVIENGDQHFSDLWERFIRYSVKEIWKPRCKTCDGHGRIYDENDENDYEGEECSFCEGKGYYSPIEILLKGIRKIENYQPDMRSCNDQISDLQWIARRARYAVDL